jgi:hypothetical protein
MEIACFQACCSVIIEAGGRVPETLDALGAKRYRPDKLISGLHAEVVGKPLETPGTTTNANYNMALAA